MNRANAVVCDMGGNKVAWHAFRWSAVVVRES